ncbi:hypothetical protein ACFQY9_34845 [Microvirga aerilata]|uniref:hypothetical protein n=1 Tax=Microvirga aerilata TaxID=670292 RepID=UPI00363B9D97
MLVKARMAAVDPTTVSTVDDLEHALEERLEAGDIIGLSLVLDVLNLHGGDTWRFLLSKLGYFVSRPHYAFVACPPETLLPPERGFFCFLV